MNTRFLFNNDKIFANQMEINKHIKLTTNPQVEESKINRNIM